MYLNKPGNSYIGVDYKYYSKRQAVDRLETICYDWFFKYHCDRFYKLKAEILRLPLSWQKRYMAAIERMRSWVQSMVVEDDLTEYQYEGSDAGDYTIDALESAIDAFIEEAEKLVPITLEYAKLKPADKATYNRSIGILK